MEFEGKELEQNLKHLKAFDSKPEPMVYNKLCSTMITLNQWKAAEAGLGYSHMGNGSTHTQEWWRQEAHKWAALWEEVEIS